jgi:hypothetical protein
VQELEQVQHELKMLTEQARPLNAKKGARAGGGGGVGGSRSGGGALLTRKAWPRRQC